MRWCRASIRRSSEHKARSPLPTRSRPFLCASLSISGGFMRALSAAAPLTPPAAGRAAAAAASAPASRS
jgi:hypothetical protein